MNELLRPERDLAPARVYRGIDIQLQQQHHDAGKGYVTHCGLYYFLATDTERRVFDRCETSAAGKVQHPLRPRYPPLPTKRNYTRIGYTRLSRQIGL